MSSQKSSEVGRKAGDGLLRPAGTRTQRTSGVLGIGAVTVGEPVCTETEERWRCYREVDGAGGSSSGPGIWEAVQDHLAAGPPVESQACAPYLPRNEAEQAPPWQKEAAEPSPITSRRERGNEWLLVNRFHQ